MIKPLFVAAAGYLGVIGLALLIVPVQFGVNAVPDDPPPALIALLRLLAGPFLGIAVLNWMSRKAEPAAIRPVMLANLVGFGVVALNDVVGIATGDARDLAKLFVIIHLAFGIAFAVALVRGSSRTQAAVR